MFKRTPGYWKWSLSSKNGLIYSVIVDANGKEIPPERPLGDVLLYANSAEMYDMLWKIADSTTDITFREQIIDLLARINVINPEGISHELVGKVEASAQEKRRKV